MISDFFLPVAGGIEIAIYSLAAALRDRGHKVRSMFAISTLHNRPLADGFRRRDDSPTCR